MRWSYAELVEGRQDEEGSRVGAVRHAAMTTAAKSCCEFLVSRCLILIGNFRTLCTLSSSSSDGSRNGNRNGNGHGDIEDVGFGVGVAVEAGVAQE